MAVGTARERADGMAGAAKRYPKRMCTCRTARAAAVQFSSVTRGEVMALMKPSEVQGAEKVTSSWGL